MGKKIIFIAGTSYSGSTLIDLILSNSSNATSVGEIESIFNPVKIHHLKKIEEIKKSKEPSLVFTVQVGAYKKANNNLSNVSNVQISQESNLYKYRLGTFLNYKDARKFRKKSLSTYPDAFVQAILNGKPISIKKALE